MKRVKAIISKVLQIPESNVDDNTSPENTENWDSFNALLLISEFEKAFNNMKLDYDEDEGGTISDEETQQSQTSIRIGRA